MTIVVTAVFFPAIGKKHELAEAMRAGIEAVHAEPGCELYAIHDADDGTITMVEKWRSRSDLDAHASGDAVALLQKSTGRLLARPTVVTTMTAIPAGTAAQGVL